MTALERAIARERRRLNADEAAARARMRDAYRGVVERLEREIDATLMQIETFPGDEWRRYHEQRLRVLLAQAEAEYQRFADDAMRVLADNEARAVSGGAHAAAEMTSALPATAGVGFAANVNRSALERMVASFAPGSPVRGVIASYGPEAMQTIERAMMDGLAAGESPRTIKRRIMREINGPYTKARLDALTRTEFMRAARGSLADSFEAMRRPGDRYRWVAAKSARTCLSCLYRDGTLYDEPPTQQHVNCRCIFHLVPADMYLPYETGEQWFARQPENVQRQMMGGAAYDEYRNGRLGLRDFTTVHRDPVWGASVQQRSQRGAIAAARQRRGG